MKIVRNLSILSADDFRAIGIASIFVLAFYAPADAGEWTITPSINYEQSITDNAFSSSEGEQGDLISTASAGLSVSGQGRRAQLNFNYNISQDKFWDNNELDGFRQSLLGAGNIEAVEDFVFVDARASISQVSLQRNGGISATDRSLGTDDQSTVVNLSITPSFSHRYGNWADTDVRFTLTETQFLNSDTGSAASQPDASRSILIQTLLRSGPKFTKLRWELSGSTTFSNNGSNRDVTELSGEYTWTRNLTLLGAAGRETIENSGVNEDDSAEFFGRVGARVTPGPRSSFSLEVSNRFNDTTFTGDASYRISSLTALTASYSVSVQTDREALANNLNNLVLDDQGQLIDPNTGQPASPNDSPFDFRDQTTKQQNFNIALNGTRGRNTFGIFSTLNVRTQLPGDINDTVVSVGANINRRIWPALTGGISANFSATTESASGVKDVTLRSGAFLNYRMRGSLTGVLRYNFLRRDSDDDTADLSENVITLNLSKSF